MGVWNAVKTWFGAGPAQDGRPMGVTDEGEILAYASQIQPHLVRVDKVLMETWPAAFDTERLSEIQEVVARTRPTLQRARDFLAGTPAPAFFTRARTLMEAAFEHYLAAADGWIAGDADEAVDQMRIGLRFWEEANEELDRLLAASRRR